MNKLVITATLIGAVVLSGCATYTHPYTQEFNDSFNAPERQYLSAIGKQEEISVYTGKPARTNRNVAKTATAGARLTVAERHDVLHRSYTYEKAWCDTPFTYTNRPTNFRLSGNSVTGYTVSATNPQELNQYQFTRRVCNLAAYAAVELDKDHSNGIHIN